MRKDILLNEVGDLAIEFGDWLIDNSDTQHVEHIVCSQKGEYKEYPLLGFGVENYLKTNTEALAFKRDLKIQLEYDEYKKPDIDVSEGLDKLRINV